VRHDRTTPCPACPFRTTSLRGWLGSYTPEGIVGGIQAEVPFPCHLTVDYERPDWRATINAPRTTVQHCAGYLYLMRRISKLPRDPVLAEHRNRVDMTADCFRSPREFIDYHNNY
jgi:hypothetical protein